MEITRVVVYGGKGALGSTLVHHFKAKDNFWVCSVDLSENKDADANIVVSGSSLEEQAKLVCFYQFFHGYLEVSPLKHFHCCT